MDRYQKVRATERSKDAFAHILNRAKTLQEDAEKKKRLATGECVVCFYSSRIGGSAITESSCQNCKKEMIFGSTCIDKLCSECAGKENLCKYCGADIDLKIRRSW
jgi:hypothetical protein